MVVKVGKIKRSLDSIKLFLVSVRLKLTTKKLCVGEKLVFLQVPADMNPNIITINKDEPLQNGYHTKQTTITISLGATYS